MSTPGLDRESGENFSLFFFLSFLSLSALENFRPHLCKIRGAFWKLELNWPAMYARVSLNRNPEPYPDYRIIGNSNLNSRSSDDRDKTRDKARDFYLKKPEHTWPAILVE